MENKPITKIVECSYESCGDRRIHWERPHEPRGQVKFEVPIAQPPPYFCSIECWCYACSENIDNYGLGKKIDD